MTKQEFLANILEYYGNFGNEGIYKQFLKVLSKIADKDLGKLFSWFLENIPANYRIDVKTLLDATKANFISFIETRKKCPVCGASIAEESRHCVYCDYDYSLTPEEFRATLVSSEQVEEQLSQMFAQFAAKQEILKKELEKKEQKKC